MEKEKELIRQKVLEEVADFFEERGYVQLAEEVRNFEKKTFLEKIKILLNEYETTILSCPINKNTSIRIDTCPICGASPRETCYLIARASFDFVSKVKGIINE